jgi:hypothetical protein
MPETGAARALRVDDDDFVTDSPSLRLVEAQAAEAAPDWLLDPGQRRTVKITGQASVPSARRRRTVTEQRIRTRPDRIALWAFLLGLFLIFIAVATANAAPPV